jgi:hypothetical protein
MTTTQEQEPTTEQEPTKETSQQPSQPLTLTELKARRGWLFSVIYLTLILLLILFLSFVEIVEKNRDVLVGILGVLTGSISAMIAVASGRDPAEIEELKEQLSRQEADRAALIARLRDAQISLQLKSDQVTQLQTLMIAELAQLRATQLTESDVELDRHVKEWLPDQNQKK